MRLSWWEADSYEAYLEANWGGQFSTITRYDNAELRDIVLEMLHVQEFHFQGWVSRLDSRSGRRIQTNEAFPVQIDYSI